MSETRKVINRNKLIKKMEETFENDKNPYITLRPCCNTLKEVRVINTEDGLKVLGLMGMNVYMFTSTEFAILINNLFEEIDVEKVEKENHILELSATDKKIENKKWYEYIKLTEDGQ